MERITPTSSPTLLSGDERPCSPVGGTLMGFLAERKETPASPGERSRPAPKNMELLISLLCRCPPTASPDADEAEQFRQSSS